MVTLLPYPTDPTLLEGAKEFTAVANAVTGS
jgi:hypothetical protein